VSMYIAVGSGCPHPEPKMWLGNRAKGGRHNDHDEEIKESSNSIGHD